MKLCWQRQKLAVLLLPSSVSIRNYYQFLICLSTKYSYFRAENIFDLFGENDKHLSCETFLTELNWIDFRFSNLHKNLVPADGSKC
jgi:hypothetical protein